jgi:hypothetical protein
MTIESDCKTDRRLVYNPETEEFRFVSKEEYQRLFKDDSSHIEYDEFL